MSQKFSYKKMLETSLLTFLVGSPFVRPLAKALNGCRYEPQIQENTPLTDPIYAPKPEKVKPLPTLRPQDNSNYEHIILVGNSSPNKISGTYLDLNKLEYTFNFDTGVYSDSNNSGNRLFKVRSKDLGRRVSSHFVLRELVSSGGQIPDYARLDPELVQGLERLRQEIGKPVIVNSGYRSFKRQKKLIKQKKAKATRSRHMSGDAADIRVKGMSGEELAQIARKLFPQAGIGVGKKFIHLDFRGHRADWKY